MYSSSRFNQAVLLQMPGVSVDLLKAPPVLTGIGAWCSLPPRGCCECYVHTSTSRAGSIFLHSAGLFWCTQPRMG